MSHSNTQVETNDLLEALNSVDELDALLHEDTLSSNADLATMELLEDMLDEATFADEQPTTDDEIDSLQVFSQDNLAGLNPEDVDDQFHPDNIDHMNNGDAIGSGIDPVGVTSKSALVSSLLGEDADEEESVEIDEEDFTLDDDEEDDEEDSDE